MVKFMITPLLDGITLQLEICSDDTIQQLKQKIESKFNINAENQELFLGEKKLDDNRTANYYKIFTDEKVRIVRKAEGFMQVSIVGALTAQAGKSTTILLKKSDTVLELKQKYFEKRFLPVEEQILIIDNHQLENHKLLSDYGVKNGMNIYLVGRLRGGF
ncbi:13679_t:CDS:1 [Funneliformis geosporum]|uniref:13419_t:CDS:1 n=1 Tax=Funneliformis geosporum TaxID=1117311 RepID=A0A9W4SDS2_9GLOM|nr:13419_t:CDS:1 [Funneliformis geosporum]CAI2167627.1 13679_t:CDS:1 [Funneliformis geosporum]